MADLERDVRQWRALALAGTGTTALLTARVLTGWPLIGRHPVRDFRREFAARLGEPGQPVDEDDLFSETPAQQVIRRLKACEVHLVDLEERLPAVIASAIDAWHGKGRNG